MIPGRRGIKKRIVKGQFCEYAMRSGTCVKANVHKTPACGVRKVTPGGGVSYMYVDKALCKAGAQPPVCDCRPHLWRYSLSKMKRLYLRLGSVSRCSGGGTFYPRFWHPRRVPLAAPRHDAKSTFGEMEGPKTLGAVDQARKAHPGCYEAASVQPPPNGRLGGRPAVVGKSKDHYTVYRSHGGPDCGVIMTASVQNSCQGGLGYQYKNSVLLSTACRRCWRSNIGGFL